MLCNNPVVICLAGILFLHTLTLSNAYGTLLARFRNTADHPISLWWICVVRAECDRGIRFFGRLGPNGGHTSFTTYVGHTFYWARPGMEHEERLQQFNIQTDKIMYVYSDETSSRNGALVEATDEELDFLQNYYTSHRKHWLSPYGRPKPKLPFVFNQHDFGPQSELFAHVSSKQVFWRCGDETNSACRERQRWQEFEIEEINHGFPKIYKIADFVSDFESQHLIAISQRLMQRSRVGDGSDSRLDPTRTSTNAWIAMNRTHVIETIYRRIGDVLGIANDRMTAEAVFNPERRRARYRDDSGVASHLEVVHFSTHEHYSPHYDNAPGEQVNLHFITFQIILSTSEDFRGGQTAFPHALHTGHPTDDRRSREGMSVESEPLSALFWYNLLEDGNLDESALYSNTEVLSGDQWMAHVSVWDPSLPEKGDPRMEHDVVYSYHDEL